MRPIALEGATREFGRPEGWNELFMGPCNSLQVQDIDHKGAPFMVTAWLPTREELMAINAGCPIMLGIGGTEHPVVFLNVGGSTSPESGQAG
jgi:hypothetical protein